MKRLNVKQKTREWLMARVGIPTASDFDKIITPAKGKLSGASDRYLAAKIAEWMLGVPLESGDSAWMERGNALEDKAVAWYELNQETDTEEVGFIVRDDGWVGASPDRFVGVSGGLEIKCPSAAQHVAYLLDPESLVADYRTQVQGTLWLSQRDWWDVLSYNPDLPQVRVRVERDEPFIANLADAVETFVQRLKLARTIVQELGWKPREPEPEPVESEDRDRLIMRICAMNARLKIDFGEEDLVLRNADLDGWTESELGMKAEELESWVKGLEQERKRA